MDRARWRVHGQAGKDLAWLAFGVIGLIAGVIVPLTIEQFELRLSMVGVATLLGFVLPLTYGINWLLDRAVPQRVTPEGQ